MRSHSQREVLGMVLSTWHRGSPAQHFGSSITGTAWFLWVLVLLAIFLGLAAGIVALVRKSEENCQHGTGPFDRVECTQGRQAKRASEVNEVGHADTVPAEPQGEYVHEVTP